MFYRLTLMSSWSETGGEMEGKPERAELKPKMWGAPVPPESPPMKIGGGNALRYFHNF